MENMPQKIDMTTFLTAFQAGRVSSILITCSMAEAL